MKEFEYNLGERISRFRRAAGEKKLSLAAGAVLCAYAIACGAEDRGEAKVTPTPLKGETPIATLARMPTLTVTATLTSIPTLTSTPTVRPTATFTPPPVAEGILFLDGDGDGVEIKDAPNLRIGGDLTIQARIKLSAHVNVDNDGGNTVLAKGISAESYALWASFFKCTDRRPAVLLNAVGFWSCASNTLASGQWVDLAVTYQGNEATFYINGVESGRGRLLGGLSGREGEPLFIGRSPAPFNEDFAGEIDFVALWNKARTQAQISEDFHSNIGNVKEAERQGLVGLWEFKGNFDDSTSYRNDGRPLGDAKIR